MAQMWVVVVLAALYVPIVSVVLASFANTRYMRFPHKDWTVSAYAEAFASPTTLDIHLVSVKVALCTVVLAVALGTLGAMGVASALRP